MTKSLLITTDREVLDRWLEAFPAAACAASPRAALDSVDPDSIVWLHLPPEPSSAAVLVWDTARLLAPARIVALSDTPSDEQALDLMERGAVGYCHSHAGAAMLKQVETVVSNQGLWVGPTLLRRLISSSLPPLPEKLAVTAPLNTLSAREREVAVAVSRGASNKEIARELVITERTVKAHLSAIFLKLGVRDRLHLALVMRSR
jgi:DNA-binding NarL/FixJ family response regulator